MEEQDKTLENANEESLIQNSEHDREIAVFYLDELKFGFPGTDPYNKFRRTLVIFNKLTASIFLTALFLSFEHWAENRDDDSKSSQNTYFQAFLVYLVLAPYGFILELLAKNELCTRTNCCLKTCKMLSSCMLTLITLTSAGYLMVGLLLVYLVLSHPQKFLTTFFFAFFLDQTSYFYTGIWSWIFLSWGGFLCLPLLPSPCPSICCSKGFPPRCLPLNNLWPVKLLLSCYGLGGSTYMEDKEEFLKKFPGRLNVGEPYSSPEQKEKEGSDKSNYNPPSNPPVVAGGEDKMERG